MARIAIFGIGAMGSRMAAVLLKAGHEVTIWNRSADKILPLVAAGAKTLPVWYACICKEAV